MARSYKTDFSAVASALGLDPDIDAPVAVAAVAALSETAKMAADIELETHALRRQLAAHRDTLVAMREELLRRRELVRARGANQAFADMSVVADMAVRHD